MYPAMNALHNYGLCRNQYRRRISLF